MENGNFLAERSNSEKRQNKQLFAEYKHAIQHVVLACYECETLQEVYPEAGEDVKWFHINQIDFASTLPGTKEFVSLAVANEWFDRLYIEFESVDSEAIT